MEDPARPRPFPVLVAFVAFLGGVLAAGVLGGPHAALLAVLVVATAEVHTRARAGRAPPWAWPVAVLFVLGAARTEVATLGPAGPDWPIEVLRADPGPHLSAEVRVERVRRRDRRATTAEVRVASFLVDGRRVEAPPGAQALLSGPGILPVLRGGTYAVHARLRAPRPPPDLLDLRWPRPRPRPVLAVSGVADVVLLSGPGIPRPSRLDAWRCGWTTRILGALDGDPGDFVAAVVLGEGQGVDPGLRLALSRLGTAHILAVSGLHVAIAAALAGLILVRVAGVVVARLAPTANLVLAGLVVASAAAIGVAALAGATPSATRAAAMCGLATASRLVHRGPRLEACAALAGLADLTLAPTDAFSLSFVLSYAAVLGIAALHRPLVRAWTPEPWRGSRVARAAVQGLCVSVAASLATAPVTLVAFGTLGVAAPLANLLVVPLLTFVVMPVAVAVLAAAAASPALLQAVSPLARPVFQAFLDGQRALASAVPGTDGPLAPLVLPASCGILAAAIAWALGSRRRVCLGLGAIPFVVLLPGGGRPAWPPGDLSVTFLDVGKGDAILVRCPTGRRYLVDTGEARALPRLLRGLTARGISTLDGVVLTHGDEDHVGALPALVRALRVRSAVAPCPEAMRPPLAGMLASLARDGVRVGCLGFGQETLAGCGADSPVLWPPALAPVSGNAASLVVRLGWAGRSVLLTGDLEAPQEEVLTALASLHVGADVLKLGHHGSAGSSSARFLATVRPALAVVSGHASRTRRSTPRAVLDRVAQAGARLRATEDAGDLTVLLAPNGIRVLSDESPPLVLSPR